MPGIIALIPARSGSKRIFDKNIHLLGGHPLLAYAIGGALENQASEATAEKPAGNPLAGIMALSEAERIALFT